MNAAALIQSHPQLGLVRGDNNFRLAIAVQVALHSATCLLSGPLNIVVERQGDALPQRAEGGALSSSVARQCDGAAG